MLTDAQIAVLGDMGPAASFDEEKKAVMQTLDEVAGSGA